jgi:hypothetical protein
MDCEFILLGTLCRWHSACNYWGLLLRTESQRLPGEEYSEHVIAGALDAEVAAPTLLPALA